MKSKLNLILAAGCLMGGWLAARATAAPADPDVTRAWESVPAERRDVGATILATGVVRPAVGAQVAVGSRASGVVRRLHVTTGDHVEAGQLLAELDPVEFETALRRSEAALANAQAEHRYAVTELERIQQLHSRDAATAVDLAQATRTAETARAREREADAIVQSARVQLDYTRIHAPIRGIVASVSTQEGETVAASFAAPTFVTIVDLSRLEVQAYIDETDIGRIEIGQSARFRVDTWPDEAFDGRITAIRPTAELRDNVVNYVTLIRIEARNERTLRPEMTTTIDIEVEGRPDVIAIPNSALRRDSGGTWVQVPVAGTVQRRDIVVGFRGTTHSEVLSGLEAGEHVIIGLSPACEASAPEARE